MNHRVVVIYTKFPTRFCETRVGGPLTHCLHFEVKWVNTVHFKRKIKKTK